jgi:hypothetical protein
MKSRSAVGHAGRPSGRSHALLVACGLLAASGTSTLAQQGEPFAFGLWGDMPYARSNDAPKIPALIADMNASDIAFSIYDGDNKDGGSPCTDDVYLSAIEMLNGLKSPTVYVPGDNEWTDCHRTNNGGYDNLERLAHVRQVMFAKPESFGQAAMALEHQGQPGAPFVENTRFTHDSIVFVTLNIPGSNNNKECTGKSARTAKQCAADNAEYAARDAANIAWMHEGFAQAQASKAPGIVLVFQGDPGFDVPETEDVNERETAGHDGYAAFLDQVAAEAKAFGGQVLLVHGDTHFFKLDKPLIDYAHLLPNVTRLQTFGSPNIAWVRVTVDPTSPEVFAIHPRMVHAGQS